MSQRHTWREVLQGADDAVAAVMGARPAWKYESTGGGCTAVMATFPDGAYLMITEDGDATCPAIPSADVTYSIGWYSDHDDDYADDHYRSRITLDGLADAVAALVRAAQASGHRPAITVYEGGDGLFYIAVAEGTLHRDTVDGPLYATVHEDHPDRALAFQWEQSAVMFALREVTWRGGDIHVNPFCSERSYAGDACGWCLGCREEGDRIRERLAAERQS